MKVGQHIVSLVQLRLEVSGDLGKLCSERIPE